MTKSILISLSTIGTLLLALIVTIWVYSTNLNKKSQYEASLYEGDGELQYVWKDLFYYGYILDFQSFGLDNDYEGKFRIDYLPQIDKVHSFHIFVEEDLYDVDFGDAFLSMKLVDGNGHVVFDESENLDKWMLSTSSGAGSTFYNMEYCCLDLEELGTSTDFTLTIEYKKNNTNMIGYKCIPRLRVGAFY